VGGFDARETPVGSGARIEPVGGLDISMPVVLFGGTKEG
jgi:hypothetical protein